MDFIETCKRAVVRTEDLKAGNNAVVHGFIHRIRDMGSFSFVVLRLSRDLLQCMVQNGTPIPSEGSAVRVGGSVREEPRAPGCIELSAESIETLSSPAEPIPVKIHKNKLDMTLENKLTMRPVTLRNPKERAVFKLQEGLTRGFREYLQYNGFTEIHTPKITAAGAEGGANIFGMEYFGRKAFLSQSPQLYKQMMVGVFEKVFEIATVFRAEKHNTARHLNEYISMDLEMGFIDSFRDIMATETGILRHTLALLRQDYAKELSMLEVSLPESEHIPCIRFDEAKRIVSEKYGRSIRDPGDLEPEEEQLISRHIKEETGSEFVFVTHYPSKKRPFYVMDDPEDSRFTLSFDLLFKGLEITSGGQRIHDYSMQLQKLLNRGMNPGNFESYLLIHRCGMPPHGGLGLGLERLLAALTGEPNLRAASLFPRDTHRLMP